MLRGILKNDFFDRIPNLRRDFANIQKCEFILMMMQMMGKVSYYAIYCLFVCLLSLQLLPINQLTNLLDGCSFAGQRQGHPVLR